MNTFRFKKFELNSGITYKILPQTEAKKAVDNNTIDDGKQLPIHFPLYPHIWMMECEKTTAFNQLELKKKINELSSKLFGYDTDDNLDLVATIASYSLALRELILEYEDDENEDEYLIVLKYPDVRPNF